MNQDQICAYLAELGKELSEQDNLATADPIFVVMQKQEIVGVDPDYNKTHVVWVDVYGDHNQCDEELSFALEKAYGTEGCKNYTRVECMDIDVWVQAFFTRKDAELFIKNNAKRLRKPFIYVESAYYNPQWKALRALMMLAYKNSKEEKNNGHDNQDRQEQP